MNTKLFAAASVLALSTSFHTTASAQPDPGCVATAGLRSGGTNDIIRVTNQIANEIASLQVDLRIIDASGVQKGQDVIVPLAANASVSKTVSQIFLGAGLRSYNPDYLIQVVQHDVSVSPILDLGLQFQATYKNSTNGQLLPLLFTCQNQPI